MSRKRNSSIAVVGGRARQIPHPGRFRRRHQPRPAKRGQRPWSLRRRPRGRRLARATYRGDGRSPYHVASSGLASSRLVSSETAFYFTQRRLCPMGETPERCGESKSSGSRYLRRASTAATAATAVNVTIRKNLNVSRFCRRNALFSSSRESSSRSPMPLSCSAKEAASR